MNTQTAPRTRVATMTLDAPAPVREAAPTIAAPCRPDVRSHRQRYAGRRRLRQRCARG